MTEIKRKLFAEFTPTPTKEWEDKIKVDLKGADYNKKLIWKTHENFEVKPYYRTEDLKGLEYLNNNPSEFPYNRGNKLDNNWRINYNINVSKIDEANSRAHKLIKQGVNSLSFYVSNNISQSDFENIINDINTTKVEIIFLSSDINIFENISEHINNSNKQFSNLFSPVSNLITTGKLNSVSENNFDSLAKNLLRNNRTINILGSNYKNAGSNTIQEIAYTISEATEYIDKLSDKGINLEDIVSKMQFTMGVSSDYFMEIAKIRATRYIWAKICEEYKIDEAKSKIYIQSENSDWNKTIYDPYVNMLRTTTEAMSAIIGGTDSLYIKGFDSIINSDNNFADRIAVNTQNILKEESYFDKITDPSAGSYYIENLTNNLIDEAWKLFLETENKGGIISAFKKEIIQNNIKEISNKRSKNLATKKEILLGTNQYPNLLEEIESNTISNKITDFDIQPINIHRGAEALESIRLETAKLDKKPKVFLFTYGNLTMRKARAMFATNFFGVAGFDVIDNADFENINDGITKFISTKSDLVVICSADDEYLSIATEISKIIDNKKIIVAGYPKSIIDDLAKINITNFVHVKSNLIDELSKYQKQLSINK